MFRQLIIDGKYKFLKALNTMFPPLELTDDDQIIGVLLQSRNSYI